ncbi:MAG: peptidoglycan DD-metalloendopeptidase family protein [Candidatus Zixiibacteriota bacterium]|nr:MAG: peptidoglycan DD-metalloendopeptidase family protein [candidate division Zixibacteria bacterium]
MKTLWPAVLAVFLCVSVSWAQQEDDILYEKKEMEKILKEVRESREKLDSLKQAEIGVARQISEGDQKLATNKKIIGRLNDEMRQLQARIGQATTELEAHELELDLVRRRYLGNIRQFYLAAHKPPEVFSEDPNEELVLHRQIVYLTALAGFESGNVDQALTELEQTRKTKKDLAGRSKQVSQLRQKKETANVLVSNAKRQHQRNLEKIRREKTEEADRILTLEQAAREMERIIARLQEEAELRRTGRTQTGPSLFASLKGQLLPPCRGEITVPFGELVDPVTKLKSFSSGITFKVRPGQNVSAVASGSVAYVGSLRGYGNFIIINHDDQYYTTYAGLDRTFVSVNEYVLAGNKLAEASPDGAVRFELREGRKALDPIEWISIESF